MFSLLWNLTPTFHRSTFSKCNKMYNCSFHKQFVMLYYGRLLSNVTKRNISNWKYVFYLFSTRIRNTFIRFIAVIKFGDYHTNVGRKYNFHMNWIWIFMSLYLHTVNALRNWYDYYVSRDHSIKRILSFAYSPVHKSSNI